MSWYFKIHGTRAAVKTALATENTSPFYLPQPLKDMIAKIADAPGATSQDGLVVESHGHFDDTYGGNVSKFEVTPVTLSLLDQAGPDLLKGSVLVPIATAAPDPVAAAVAEGASEVTPPAAQP